jgi:uncharacterized protein (TIGR03437 family)
VDSGNPTRPGETIHLLATGLGAVSGPATAGLPAGAAPVAASVRAFVGGVEVAPSYAGLAPGTAGLYQITLVLPANLAPTAPAPISIVVGGQPSNALTLPLRAP